MHSYEHRADYAAYIQSDHWAAVRRAFWAQTARECARCKTTTDLHVHHMTYERFTKEHLSDLIGLCQRCHSLVHHVHALSGGDLRAVTLKVVNLKNPPVRKQVPSRSRKKPKPTPYVPIKPIFPVDISRRTVRKKEISRMQAKDDAYNAVLRRRTELEGH